MPTTTRNQSRARRHIVAACIGAAAFLNGCSTLGLGGSKDEGVPGVVGSVRGFLGGAAADEPRAALVARDILSAGGSAADAAAAAALTLTVTYPGQLPLGGGGMCLVASGTGRVRTVETVSFPAVAARPDSTVATPGLPRGLFAMQARYGRLRWEQVVAPAENLARGGTTATRALAIDLARNWNVVSADPALAAIFSRDGQPLTEGQPLAQPLMGAVIGALRQRGPGELHQGITGQQLALAAQAAGIDLRFEDLAAGVPQILPAFNAGGTFDFFVAAAPAVGSLATAQLYGALERSWRATPADLRAGLMLATAAAASRDRAQWLGPDLSNRVALGDALAPARLRALAGGGGQWAAEPDTQAGTALSVIDRNGMAVACSFTGVQPFGIARLPQGIGFLLAPAPTAENSATRWLTAAIALRDRQTVIFAGAASGGIAAPYALSQTVLGVLADQLTLDRALDQARAAPLPDGRIGVDGPGLVPALAARGYRAAEVAGGIGRVQAVYCAEGATERSETCRIETDRRGAGFATGSQ
ncbi:MAG: gamma-glutamyltransferase [Telmatospirillum sp.]|nr:gamma-glutamyltransferase [Telmatospirillum sp.]